MSRRRTQNRAERAAPRISAEEVQMAIELRKRGLTWREVVLAISAATGHKFHIEAIAGAVRKFQGTTPP